MDPLDKLELLVKDRIQERKSEFERGKGKHNPEYLLTLENEINALSWVSANIDSIRRMEKKKGEARPGDNPARPSQLLQPLSF